MTRWQLITRKVVTHHTSIIMFSKLSHHTLLWYFTHCTAMATDVPKLLLYWHNYQYALPSLYCCAVTNTKHSETLFKFLYNISQYKQRLIISSKSSAHMRFLQHCTGLWFLSLNVHNGHWSPSCALTKCKRLVPWSKCLLSLSQQCSSLHWEHSEGRAVTIAPTGFPILNWYNYHNTICHQKRQNGI